MTIWWVVLVIVAVLWMGTWYFWGFDWHQISLGVLTGTMLASWAYDMTGGKVPDSWRPKPPRSR